MDARWRDSLRRSRDPLSALVASGRFAEGGLYRQLHPVQRWRVDIGVRTLSRLDDGSLIFSGAPTRGGPESEAVVMARHAVAVLGAPEDRIHLEQRARSTWDNVRYSLPLLEVADQIAIASDPLHAEKARRYLAAQRPDLVQRVVRAADYRFLDRWWLKPATVANHVRLRVSASFGEPPASARGESDPSR